MNVVCVDDEKILMENTISMCLDIPNITDVKGFTSSKEMLEWLNENSVDIALIDIEMAEINGLELAKKLKIYRQIPTLSF